MNKEKSNNTNIIIIVILIILSIKIGQKIYKHNQETKLNNSYNAISNEQLEIIKKMHDKIKRDGKIMQEQLKKRKDN